MSATSNMSVLKILRQTSEHRFPALFTVEDSSRHEIFFLINPGVGLPELTSQIEHLVATSPNAVDGLRRKTGEDKNNAEDRGKPAEKKNEPAVRRKKHTQVRRVYADDVVVEDVFPRITKCEAEDGPSPLQLTSTLP
ncbi:hypothetical protein Q7P36_002324 [Cladosporium allicinum]